MKKAHKVKMEIFANFDQDFSDLVDVSALNAQHNHYRNYRNRPNYLSDLSNQQFFERFRMSKESFEKLLMEVQEDLEPVSLR